MFLKLALFERLYQDGRIESFYIRPKDAPTLIADSMQDTAEPAGEGEIDMGGLRIYANEIGIEFRHINSKLANRRFESSGDSLRFKINHTGFPLEPGSLGYYALLLPEGYVGKVKVSKYRRGLLYLTDTHQLLVTIKLARYADDRRRPDIQISGTLNRNEEPHPQITRATKSELFRVPIDGDYDSSIGSFLRIVNRGAGNEAPSVFICHSSTDKAFARRLSFYLSGRGIRVWLDEAEIKIGNSLIEKIENGIFSSNRLLVILSSESVSSKWCKEELRMAMAMQIAGRPIRVLPVLIEDCQIPGFLLEKVYADFRNEEAFNDKIDSLCDAISQ